jgi:hypothetical protein
MKREITIQGRHTILTTKAHIKDNLAIHRTFGTKDFWTITHLPTGMSVTQRCFSYQNAFQLTRQLNTCFNWSFTREDMKEHFNEDQNESIKRLIRTYTDPKNKMIKRLEDYKKKLFI